jgi:hypothetical protein
MAKVSNKLTDTGIRQAKPKEKAYKLSDGKGLFLLIQPDGKKYWLSAYTLRLLLYKPEPNVKMLGGNWHRT